MSVTSSPRAKLISACPNMGGALYSGWLSHYFETVLFCSRQNDLLHLSFFKPSRAETAVFGEADDYQVDAQERGGGAS